jgi:hypothetical protein
MSIPTPVSEGLNASQDHRGQVHRVDTIPDADRTSSWLDLLRIQFGAPTRSRRCCSAPCRSRSASRFGGRGARHRLRSASSARSSLMPMGLFGPKTGTNNAVSSATAFFRVRGRIDRILPLAPHRGRVLLDLGLGEAATLSSGGDRLGSVPDSLGLRTPRLRRHRRACDHRGRLRFPVHAPREQDRGDCQRS